MSPHVRRKNAQTCKVKAICNTIGQSEHTASGNAQMSPRVRRRNAQTCKKNGNDDCTQIVTEQSTDFTKDDRDFQPIINEHLDMLSPTDNDENIHCDNDSQISAAIDEQKWVRTNSKCVLFSQPMGVYGMSLSGVRSQITPTVGQK